MTDQREKRIQEIREARKRTDVKFEWITEDVRQADEWIDTLLEEIDHLKQIDERECEFTIKLKNELSRLQVERDKAIAELRRFADRDPYATGSSAKRVLSELGVPHENT